MDLNETARIAVGSTVDWHAVPQAGWCNTPPPLQKHENQIAALTSRNIPGMKSITG